MLQNYNGLIMRGAIVTEEKLFSAIITDDVDIQS